MNFSFKFEAIGTHWLIDCFGAPVPEKEIIEKVKDRIEEFDKTYSRFRKDSLVWKISEKKGEYTFPKDSKDFFALYEKLYKVTNGAFTLLIGNALSEAGYDANYSLVPKEINKVSELNSVYSWDYPKLTVKKPYILDFGGLGKGYLIKIVADLLMENKVKSFSIDAGGDMLFKNLKKPIRVGLENPINFKQVIGVVELADGSICASSGSRRKWGKYHHIFDPRTLTSPDNILSTWVIAEDSLIADGMSTCLFLTPAKKLREHFNFEYLILYPDFRIEKSENFPGQLFTRAV